MGPWPPGHPTSLNSPSSESWLPPLPCLGQTDPFLAVAGVVDHPPQVCLRLPASAICSTLSHQGARCEKNYIPAEPLHRVNVLLKTTGKLHLHNRIFLWVCVCEIVFSLIKNILLLLSYYRSNKCSSQKSWTSQSGIKLYIIPPTM